ncbi:hypothetical protein Nepgr_010477 [Nepenthes gracilis]|uniref:Uncharacterized protein n=1 Tax=Nepenthes gracilis TaxID=150966 RepID=A0AAD3XL45_NEPGR|nr:hypothetical protein Nepgr_010477 [Nepenthes gracilis]
MRTLTHSDLEQESQGESPLKNDGAGQTGSSRVQRVLNCDPHLLEDGQLVGVPPGPSTTSNPSVTRSSRLTARRVPTTLYEAGSSSHAECLPPVLGEKDVETPSGKAPAKKTKGPKKEKPPSPLPHG